MAARTRTLTFRAEIQAGSTYFTERFAQVAHPPGLKLGEPTFSCSALGFIEFRGHAHTTEEIAALYASDRNWKRFTFSVIFTNPAFSAFNWAAYVEYQYTANGTWNLDLGGSYMTVQVEAEEVVVNASTGMYPTYGGVSVPDGPTETNQTRYEIAKPGTDLIITVSTPAGGTVITIPITALNTFTIRYDMGAGMICEAWGLACGCGANLTISSSSGSETLTCPYSQSNSHHTSSSGSCYAFAAAPDAGGAYRTTTGVSIYPPRKWRLYPRIRAMEQAYPGSVGLRVDRKADDLNHLITVGGDGSQADSEQQERYEASAVWEKAGFTFDELGFSNPRNWGADSSPMGLSLNEYYPFRCWFDNAFLSANNEDVRDWRTLILETPFSVYSLIHDDERDVEDGTNVWTNIANTAPSNTGGRVVLAVSGGIGSAERIFALTGRENTINPADDWQSYRYLEIVIQADNASEPFTLEFEGKEYEGETHATPNTDSTIRFDLNAPYNPAGATDGTDSRWPLTSAAGDFFGIVKNAKLKIEGLSDGVTYRIDRISLTRTKRAKVSHALAFEKWTPNGVGSEYNRHLTGEVDGKIGLEVAGLTRTGGTIGYPTLQQVVDAINERPGWTATAETVFLDASHDLGEPGMWAGGKDGGYYDGGWRESFDQIATKALSIKACKAFDSLEWFWHCGDLQSLAYGEYTPMRISKAIRGEVWGVVINSDTHEGFSGQTVEVSGGASGSESLLTDTSGHFRSGPRKTASTDVEWNGETLTMTVLNRYRTWSGFGGVATSGYKALEVDSPRAWLHIADDNVIVTYNSISGVLMFQSLAYPVDFWKKLRFDQRQAALFMLGVAGSTFSIYKSTDGGRTGTEVITVTANSALIEVHSEEGKISFYFEDGAEVFRHESASGDVGTWGSPEVVQYDDGGTLADLEAVLLDMAREQRDGGAVFLAVTQGSDTKIFRSRDAGKTFEIVLT